MLIMECSVSNVSQNLCVCVFVCVRATNIKNERYVFCKVDFKLQKNTNVVDVFVSRDGKASTMMKVKQSTRVKSAHRYTFGREKREQQERERNELSLQMYFESIFALKLNDERQTG